MKKQDNVLLPIGIGIGLGATAIWAAVELLPIAMIGGAGYLIVRSLKKNKEEVEDICQENGPNKKSN